MSLSVWTISSWLQRMISQPHWDCVVSHLLHWERATVRVHRRTPVEVLPEQLRIQRGGHEHHLRKSSIGPNTQLSTP